MVINERGSIMYINRKDGTLVEARFKYNIGFWKIYKSGNLVKELEDKDFREQYGEAMICPDKECKVKLGKDPCPESLPHICIDKSVIMQEPPDGMGCPACIPYIPEQKDPDEGLEVRPEIIERLEKSRQIPKEELLTSGQMREKLGIGQSNLMLSDE
jgi:hypothetical protein